MKDEIKVRNMVITIADRQKIIKIGDDNFTFQIPLPVERVQLSTQIANYIGGKDLKSLQAYEYQFAKMIVTLNFVIVKAPDWWEGSEKCIDDNLLGELYKEFNDFEEEFQESLKKNKFSKLNGKI
jgi:hypothetical protein